MACCSPEKGAPSPSPSPELVPEPQPNPVIPMQYDASSSPAFDEAEEIPDLEEESLILSTPRRKLLEDEAERAMELEARRDADAYMEAPT